MKETYLETDKFPRVALKVLREGLRGPNPDAARDQHAQGSLSLHGVTRAWAFTYEAEPRTGGFEVHAWGTLNLGDYAIETPKYLGVGVKPDIAIDVRFTLEDKP